MQVILTIKVRLVVEGYTQTYGLNYGDTVYPIAKIATVILFLLRLLFAIGFFIGCIS